MAYVTVEVDMADINSYELVEEVCWRLTKKNSRKSFSDEEKKQIKESFLLLGESRSVFNFKHIEVKTLDDKMKYEHLFFIFNKYSVEQIQNLLP